MLCNSWHSNGLFIEFINRMLETITGGKAFIKYLQKEDGKNV